MDLTMYQEYAKYTMNKELDDRDQYATMAMGIPGELSEFAAIFDPEQAGKQMWYRIIDEAGDVFWYITNTCSLLGIGVKEVITEERLEDSYVYTLTHKAMIVGGNVSDLIKKMFGQGHELDKGALVGKLKHLVSIVLSVLDLFNMDLGMVLAENQLKLAKRYPGGFKEELSINREV